MFSSSYRAYILVWETENKQMHAQEITDLQDCYRWN